MKQLKIGTVFSGIGAAEQAIEQLGIKHKIVFACDNGERHLEKSYDELHEEIKKNKVTDIESFIRQKYDETGKDNNVKKSYFANYEIQDSDWYEDIRFLDGKKYEGKVDLIVGGSPCQSFSTYGKRKGLEDTRGTLFYDYARLIKEIKPKAFMYENVTGLLNHDKGRTWEIIKEVFLSLNYEIDFSVLDAQNYNLPQMRKRLFVVGINKDLKAKKFKFPNKIPLQHTVEEYLEKDIPKKYYLPFKGFRYVTDWNRNGGRARVNRKVIGCQTANQQFNWTGDFRVETPKEEHILDEKIYVGEFDGKPAVARKLMPIECLSLMGFKNFKIVVNDKTMYRQVGNSIAVPVLEAIIKNILEVI